MKEIFSVFKNSLAAKVATLSLSMLMLCMGVAFAQTQTRIKGTVTDEKGTPLVGATVLVVGTQTGTTTDGSGAYFISVKKGAVLDFSYIGFKSERISFATQAVINVVLKEDAARLEDVIVVGFGTQKKASLTAAVSQIKGEELQKSPSTNVSSMLGGRLPGLSSLQSSGQPGADQAQLKIRGSRAGVTYVVDGMVRSISDIDPNDIESISVLKDGGAAAVYGLTAAGGVIIVTTKKGNRGDAKITYKGSYGVSQNAYFPEFLDGPGYAYWYNKAYEQDQIYKTGTPPQAGQYPFKKEQVEMMLNDDPNDGWGNTNWIDKTFGTGSNTQHSITATGGSEKITYFTSIGYLNQKGNIKNFDFERFNLRGNLESKIAKNLTLTFGIAGQIGNRTASAYGAGGSSDSATPAWAVPWLSVAEQAIYSHPYLPMEMNGLPVASAHHPVNNQPVNPIAATERSGLFKNNSTDIQSNLALKWDIPWVDGLSLKVVGGYDCSFTFAKNFSTPYKVMRENYMLGTYTEMLDARNYKDPRLTEASTRWNKINSQASINYENTFGKHSVAGTVLVETRQYKTNYLNATKEGFAFPQIPEIDNGLKPFDGAPMAGNSSQTRYAGFVARFNYDYDQRYLVEVSGRLDGGWKFIGNSPEYRWGTFPGASVGWRMSNEDFFEGLRSVVDNLKIRASYGQLGSDGGVANYAFLSTLNFINKGSNQVVFGGLPYQGLYTSVVPNERLTWERTTTYNIGFDATLWKGLLGVEFDAFCNYTTDILAANSGFPPSMGGYYETYVNNNKVEAKGLEVALSHENTVGEFKYGARFNLSWARDRWLRYKEDPNIPDYMKRTGKSTSAKLIMVSSGLFQSEEEINNSPYIMGSRPRPGDIKYVDINGDGVITHQQDRMWAGRNTMPELMGGLSLYGSWKGLDFNVLFTGAAICDVAITGAYMTPGGNVVEDNTVFTLPFKGRSNSPRYLVEGAWTPENPNADYPRLSIEAPNTNNAYSSTFWSMDGKYLRLKSAQIGYTFPTHWMKKIGVDNLRVFVEGSNLFTLTGLPEGMDPERPGVSNGYYPQQRTFMGGLTITF